jgi:hypothetical protein
LHVFKRGLIFLVCAGALFGVAHRAPAGPHDAMLYDSHPWARFGKGAWRHVRIVTQSFDEQGQPTDSSLTDNKTTVLEVTPERVTLQVEVTVEVAGQRFPSQPQIIKQGYAGETLGDTTSFKPLEAETLTIDGQEIRCASEQIEIAGGVTREINVITFAADRRPAILRRKSTLSDATGSKVMQEVTSEVKAIDMAHRVLDAREPKDAYLVRVDQKNDRGTTITWSWHVPEVPGEIVDQCSKKLDAMGRLVRRTTLEVVAYGVGEPADIEQVETRDGLPPSPRRPRRQQRRAK